MQHSEEFLLFFCETEIIIIQMRVLVFRPERMCKEHNLKTRPVKTESCERVGDIQDVEQNMDESYL